MLRLALSRRPARLARLACAGPSAVPLTVEPRPPPAGPAPKPGSEVLPQMPIKGDAEVVPSGHSRIDPWVISRHADAEIQFMSRVFGARERPSSRMLNADGTIGHVERSEGTRLNSSHTVISTLSLHDALPISRHADAEIQFMSRVFGARERPSSRMLNADGTIGHVE